MSTFRKQHMAVDWNNLIDSKSEAPAAQASLRDKAALVGRTGLLILSVGAGAYRVRSAMNKISRALGIVCTADISLLSIEYTCSSGGDSYTSAYSLSTTGVNTDRLNRLRAFADYAAEQSDKKSISELFAMLDDIEHTAANYSAIRLALAAAVACACFTFLLGGGAIEMIFAFFGAGAGNFVRKKLLERHITLCANVCLGVAAACLTYIALISVAEAVLHLPPVHHAGYICAMLFVIPGFPLITGGIDLAKLDLRSGLERELYALLIVFVATATGWACARAFSFYPENFRALNLCAPALIALRLAASFAAVYGFSLMFNSTQKMALTAALIGMVANVLRLELLDFTNLPLIVCSFAGALCAGLLASLIKKRSGLPRLTVTVPSIVIMVPGMFMYKGIYFLAAEDINTGALWLLKAGMVVCSLSFGLIAARILTDPNFRVNS